MTLEVSVVIPCYNSARFVGSAIESVLTQTVTPAEVIVVDDGSTDASIERVADFKDRVTRVRLPENRGAAAARNAGIRMSRHGYLAFLDADDLWPKDSLETRLTLLGDPALDIAYGRVREWIDGGTASETTRETSAGVRMAGTMLARREVFDRVGLLDEGLRTSEVVDWFARADALQCRYQAAEEVVLVRRVHGQNTMIHAPGKTRDVVTVLRRAVSRRRQAIA